MKSFVTLVVSVSLLVSCSGSKNGTESVAGNSSTSEVGLPGPKCIVYKTKKDYSSLIPVILSKDKLAIVSYPDVRDIGKKDGYSFPTPLAGGYLLDNRGIGPGVAFLSYSYESYGAMQRTPEASELIVKIIDMDPLLEMYDCGNKNKYSDIVKELNDIILKDGLKQFKRLK